CADDRTVCEERKPVRWGSMTSPTARLRRIRTGDLDPAEVAAIRGILVDAFADEGPDEQFTDADWQHALGGTHVVLDAGGEIVSHASVVERELRVGGRPLRTGYVEAVATAPAWRGRGHGTTDRKSTRLNSSHVSISYAV